jgi:hypothetical protein
VSPGEIKYKTAKNEAEVVEERKCILLIAINPFVVVLAILTITVILNLGLSIPGPETLTSLYDICLQPTTAINYSKLCATKKPFALI